ncbi:unnamed protein product [Bemisia tabaci]|uniref:Beta-galactoside alpha-2,6-sialyltransferase 1 n=1 Tax=Bemisia tabaci TaxID=7038 RepID=A0A9P0AEF9_BEMTA|nr:unnamed protein product [Bemisia tabaci]
MKTLVLSVWIFINLILFGMFGYILLIWSQHWHAVSHKHQIEALPEESFERPLVEYFNDDFKRFMDNIERPRLEKRSKPPLMMIPKETPVEPAASSFNDTLNRVKAHKNSIMLRLRRVLYSESDVQKFQASNPYNVNYTGLYGTQQGGMSKESLLCSLKQRLPFIKTLRKEDVPFKENLSKSLFEDHMLGSGKRYQKCAIVSNAGSLINSKSGYFIDDHDLVLRFNHAPTDGYVEDVGMKTDIRIVNSKVASNPKFEFLSSPRFRNVTILVWDPCSYSSSLKEWLASPEHPFLEPFMKHRKLYPKNKSYILDPRQLWTLYDYLQAHTPVRLRPNPPSSGLLGLALLLPHCNVVNMIEFVPSVRLTQRCHYFEPFMDEHCTFGVWHPLAAEKFLMINMNSASDIKTYQNGYVSIQGFNTLKCN